MAADKLMLDADKRRMVANKPPSVMSALIEEAALKMKNPEETSLISRIASSGIYLSRRSPWSDLSLAGGYPGLLLLFTTLERAGISQEGISHRYVLAIHQAINRQSLTDLSLYNGVAGICFALREASHNKTRYQGMLQTLDNVLLQQVEIVYLEPLRSCRKHQQSVPSELHDLIQGLPGIGRYLLEDLPLFGILLEQVIKALVEFSKPTFQNDKPVPGWHLSAHDRLNIRSKTCQNGNFNLGLAHGIPGVLAFLSIASLKGVNVAGQQEAMTRIAEWIHCQSISTDGTIRWPSCLSLEENNKKPTRDAWCYGVPGVARALFLCGKALKNKELSLFACKAFQGIFQRTRKDWDLPGPMLCHGLAGLLLLTQAMAQDSVENLWPHVENLQQLLINSYQKDSLFGYKDLHLNIDGKLIEVDSAGLLEGTAGVLLTLLHSITKDKSSWHLPFLVDA